MNILEYFDPAVRFPWARTYSNCFAFSDWIIRRWICKCCFAPQKWQGIDKLNGE